MKPDLSTPPRQLILNLEHEACLDPDQFLVSASNAKAHALVEGWPSWTDRTVVLAGPAGSGKSHLASIWAARSEARVVYPGDRLNIGEWPTPLVALIEDVDRAAHSEHELFHLLNIVNESAGWLLMTARTAPSFWTLTTPDLLSRLRLAPIVSIDPPDNALLKAVTVKLFADRQVTIDEDVVEYAALHCDQSLEAISAFVAMLDDDALTAGRRITKSLAAKTLSRLQETDVF